MPSRASADALVAKASGALRATGLPQLATLALCALRIGLEWPRGPWGAALAERRALRERRALVHVAWALGSLKGPWAKLGQFAAARHDLLPRSATDALATLRDQVPPLGFERIRGAVEAELGGRLEDHFRDFDSLPLGAASIAQVHHAHLHDGREVAVKVQYPWLRWSLPADLLLVRCVLRLVARRRGAVERERLLLEFASGLREELDFRREARNASEIGANLGSDERVLVPEVVASHSTRRVLTMRYVPAVGIADRAGLARLGVRPADVLEILARAYAAQIFEHGLFHADPHPGNLFVVDEPGAGARPRLLFVDFGLSRRLDPELQRELRLGLFALVQRDPDAFVAGMQRMGMIAPGAEDGVRRAVSRMFDRIAEVGGALGVGGGAVLGLKDEAVALLRETPGLQLPNDLLLYAKTLSYVFSLGAVLDPATDVMKLALPYLLRFLATRDGAATTSAVSAADPGAG